MSNPRLVLDGLWHCLCPSLSGRGPARAGLTRLRLSRRSASSSSHARRVLPPSIPPRLGAPAECIRRPFSQQQQVQHDFHAQLRPRRVGSRKQPDDTPLSDLSTEEIYEKTQLLASRSQYEHVQTHVHYLVRERHEEPNIRLYSALILANVDPLNGSVEALSALLDEMETERITPDSRTYHNILKVLAVHPDYLLRTSVLSQMRERWYNLTPEGHHDIIAGLLRERQYELAHSYLSHMQSEAIPIQPWLYDTFLYRLLSASEISAALSLIHSHPSPASISPNVLSALLDVSARSLHHPGVTYAWRARVEPGYLNPPDGICEHVLATAARHGDAVLAADVFRVLGNRLTRFQLHHYEALLEACLAARDIKTALTVPSIMVSAANLAPDAASTRALVAYLRSSHHTPRQAMPHLLALKEEGRPIPVCVVNAFIEASVLRGDLDTATEHYKLLRKLSPEGPVAETFNLLLRGCARHGKGAKATAAVYWDEMRRLRVPPDSETYEALVAVALAPQPEQKNGDGIDTALRLVGEMRAKGWQVSSDTGRSVVDACVRAGDGRVWDLVQGIQDQVERQRMRTWAEEKIRDYEGGVKVTC